MVTVALMKTAVAKNLSQSIIICIEHQIFTKPYFWGDARAFPGFHYAMPLPPELVSKCQLLALTQNESDFAHIFN